MAKSLVWKDMSMKQIFDYQSLKPPQESRRYLKNLFKLDDSEKDEIILDLYYYTLSFSKESDFTPEQTSALFSIIKVTHCEVVSTSQINLEKDFAYFKNLLLAHSIHRPPFSEKIFSFAEFKLVMEHIIQTYFRHYLMYKYVFTKKMRLGFVVENFMLAAQEPGDIVRCNTDEDISSGVSGDLSERIVEKSMSHDFSKPPRKECGVEDTAPRTNSSPDGGSVTEFPKSMDELVPTGESTIIPISREIHKISSSCIHHSPTSASQAIPHTLSNMIKDNIKPDEINNPEKIDEDQMPDSKRKVGSVKQELAIAELKGFISSVLATKVEDIRSSLLNKLSAQEEHINSKLKKIEGGLDENKKKDPKIKPKK
ncbi:hypothetical protein BASA61_007797 [Batrachochytrium salamandrivorans]|nr:hypothetical protein BASA61_007797 [Batrachochytrium salamandrivorans]